MPTIESLIADKPQTAEGQPSTLALETWIEENAHSYPQHRKYLAVAEQITGALAFAAHLSAKGVMLRTRGEQAPSPLYVNAQISGELILAAFGICYECLLAEKDEMVRQAEVMVIEN